jgi:hypothetical protein
VTLGGFGVALFAALGSSANAAYITYTFDSTIYSASFGGPSASLSTLAPDEIPLDLPAEFENPASHLGTPISGYFTYNDAAVDSDSDPHNGEYGGLVNLPFFSVSLLGHTFALNPYAPNPYSNGIFSAITVWDDFDTAPYNPFLLDLVEFQSQLGSGFFPDTPADAYRVSFALIHEPIGDLTTVTSDAIPTDLTAIHDWNLFVTIYDPATSINMQWLSKVELARYTPTTVPEPGTMALLSIGLLGLAVSRIKPKPKPPVPV